MSGNVWQCHTIDDRTPRFPVPSALSAWCVLDSISLPCSPSPSQLIRPALSVLGLAELGSGLPDGCVMVMPASTYCRTGGAGVCGSHMEEVVGTQSCDLRFEPGGLGSLREWVW